MTSKPSHQTSNALIGTAVLFLVPGLLWESLSLRPLGHDLISDAGFSATALPS